MTYDFGLVQYLFLHQTRLNVLMPFICLILKCRINQAINQDMKDGTTKIRCLSEIQKELLGCTVLNGSLNKYPLSLCYIRRFLNKLIHLFEELFESNCLLDDIYPLYAEYISAQTERLDRSLYDDHTMNNQQDLLDQLCRLFENDESVGFVHHQFDTFQVSIIEMNKIVSTGTTGLRTWPAAIHLLDYLKQHKINLQTNNHSNDIKWNRNNGKWCKVVELGSGCGLLGIGLIKSGFIADNYGGHYIFTDNNEAVFKQIELNLFVNEMINTDDSLKVFIQKLDWFDYKFFDFSSSISDLIIASDVVFDPNLIEPFLHTLRTMFNVYKDADSLKRYPDCIICCAIRNHKLMDYFHEKLEQCGFESRQLDHLERPLWVDMVYKQIMLLSNDIVIDQDFKTILANNTDNVQSIIYQINVKSQ